MNKINSAFGLGGPPLMVRTIEAATGLVINDYVEVNFLGFVKVINAVGGVNVCLPFAVNDAYSGLDLSAGVHHVDGVTALEYARDRHSFALSDLARISDQQRLLATMLSQSVSAGTLSDPFKLRRLLSSATSAIQVDRGFDVVSLANQLRGIRPSDVVFSTVPLGNPDYQTPSGESAVIWNGSAASRLFAQLKNDRPPAAVHRASRPAKSRSRKSSAAVVSPATGQTSAPDQGKTAAQETCH
jgi:LCP family protein required for cell wall assembly